MPDGGAVTDFYDPVPAAEIAAAVAAQVAAGGLAAGSVRIDHYSADCCCIDSGSGSGSGSGSPSGSGSGSGGHDVVTLCCPGVALPTVLYMTFTAAGGGGGCPFVGLTIPLTFGNTTPPLSGLCLGVGTGWGHVITYASILVGGQRVCYALSACVTCGRTTPGGLIIFFMNVRWYRLLFDASVPCPSSFLDPDFPTVQLCAVYPGDPDFGTVTFFWQCSPFLIQATINGFRFNADPLSHCPPECQTPFELIITVTT